MLHMRSPALKGRGLNGCSGRYFRKIDITHEPHEQHEQGGDVVVVKAGFIREEWQGFGCFEYDAVARVCIGFA